MRVILPPARLESDVDEGRGGDDAPRQPVEHSTNRTAKEENQKFEQVDISAMLSTDNARNEVCHHLRTCMLVASTRAARARHQSKCAHADHSIAESAPSQPHPRAPSAESRQVPPTLQPPRRAAATPRRAPHLSRAARTA